MYGHTRDVLMLNPVSGLFEGFRAVLLYGDAPALWHVAVPLSYALALLAIFVPCTAARRRTSRSCSSRVPHGYTRSRLTTPRYS